MAQNLSNAQNIVQMHQHKGSCTNLIKDLCDAVDKANTKLIDNMTEPNVNYKHVCIKPNLVDEYYFKCLKKDWERIVNGLTAHPEKCGSIISNLKSVYDFVKSVELKKISESESLEDITFDTVANIIMSSTDGATGDFVLDHDVIKTLNNLLKVLSNNCECTLVNIFGLIVEKYRGKYLVKFQGKTKEEVVKILKEDYNFFINLLNSTRAVDIKAQQENISENFVSKLTGMFGFSLEHELDNILPNELGAMKKFFKIVMIKYFNNIHPIIWAQMIKRVLQDIFVDLPYTPTEIFAFLSKCILVNSSPFLLKMLQQSRPFLSKELRKKYNLTKLMYPVLTTEQVNLILKKVVKDWDLYNVNANITASVGHVCIVNKIDNPGEKFVIKILKPLAVAQSCVDYKVLTKIDEFPEGSCEQEFMKGMLTAIGKELNSVNEKQNIMRGNKYYTCSYQGVFGYPIEARLKTITVKDGIVPDDCWFTCALTYATGIPLSKLVENDLIEKDTKYRAKLHRCIDLLVSKFFVTVLKEGFYHGDLHAGNMLFSYENNAITLIDFGSVGEINIHENNPTTSALIEILTMSMFYNYTGMLDVMTKLVNSRCTDTQIDMNSPEYNKLKQELHGYRIENMRNWDKESKKRKTYQNDIFSDKRLNDEKSESKEERKETLDFEKSIYSYLDYKPKPDEVIVQNDDPMPKFTNVPDKAEGKTFNDIVKIIIAFYAQSGVNVAVKFNDLVEFQKGYGTLLGVLTQIGYNSYRYSIVLRKTFLSIESLEELRHISSVIKFTSAYWKESGEYDKLKKELGISNKKYEESPYTQMEQSHEPSSDRLEQQTISSCKPYPKKRIINMHDIQNIDLEKQYRQLKQYYMGLQKQHIKR
jgi:hypothetical protein